MLRALLICTVARHDINGGGQDAQEAFELLVYPCACRIEQVRHPLLRCIVDRVPIDLGSIGGRKRAEQRESVGTWRSGIGMVDDQFLPRTRSNAEGLHEERDFAHVAVIEAFLFRRFPARVVLFP